MIWVILIVAVTLILIIIRKYHYDADVFEVGIEAIIGVVLAIIISLYGS